MDDGDDGGEGDGDDEDDGGDGDDGGNGESELKVAQSCLILQARILEWVAFPFSRGSS